MAKAKNLRISRQSSGQGDQRENNSTEHSRSGSHQNGDKNPESITTTQHENEGRTYECVVQDPDGKRTRGKTVLAEIWNMPEGHRIVVEINKSNQPIGDEGGVLGYFCGTIARNGGLCSLSYTRWDHLKKGNKGNNQTLILKEVQKRFLYAKILEKWILKSINHKWRDYKCLLKGKHYSDDANITELQNNVPQDVVNDQWISIVNFWRSDEGQKRSAKSRLSHKKAKTKPIHTSGTKSHARIYEDLKKSLQRSPTRTEVYLECHQHKNEANVTDQIKEIAAQQEHLDGNLDDDPVAQVLGKDKYGRVRGLGLGVKPSDLVEASSTLHYSNGLNMSTTEETSMYLIHN
ncbi:uncharacterized protein LOC141649899 [Silene latifolia]|uniref:uncharacterized protein LOC141649899 n=1 Tax=Silene latifolia TaxID=37657 RepID=UPI003D78767F